MTKLLESVQKTVKKTHKYVKESKIKYKYNGWWERECQKRFGNSEKIATWTSKNRKAQYLSRKEKGKKSLGGNNNGLDTTKGRIGELEENSAKEIIKSEAHTHKKYLKNEYSFNLWDISSNITAITGAQREERENRTAKNI